MAAITKWSLTAQTLSGFTKGYDGNRGFKDGTIRTRVIDFSNVTTNQNGLLTRLKQHIPAGDTYAGYTALDEFAVIALSKGDLVLNVGACVLQKDTTAACALVIGDTGTADKFIASFGIGSGANNGDIAWGTVGSVSYEAADAVIVTLKTAVAVPTNAIVKIAAVVISVFPEIAATAL